MDKRMKLQKLGLCFAFCLTALTSGNLGTPVFAAKRTGLMLGVQSYGYLAASNLQSEGKNSILPGFYGSIDWETLGSRFEGVVNVEGFLSATGIDNSYFIVKELYLASSRTWNANQLSLGRRHFDYSVLDSFWDLGVYEPRARWDQFNVQEQGLSGFFYTRKLKSFEFVVYASPVFIPEQSSDYRIDEKTGVVSSPNPFDPIPPTQKGLSKGNLLPIRYSLNTPDIIEEVLLKPGIGAMARVGRNTGPWGQVGYAYKPLNQVLVSYDPHTNATAEKALLVEVYPRFLYHHVVSIDSGFKMNDWGVWGGTMADFVVQDTKVPIHVNQEISNSLFLSLGTEKIFNGLFFGSLSIRGAYLKRMGGTSPDSGDLTTGNHSLFETRFHLTEAVKGGFEIRAKNRKLSFNTSFIYDFPIQGVLLSGEVTYHPKRNWRLFFGGEMVGVGPDGDEGFDQSGGTNWFARIRGTDRIRGGVTYAF